MTTQKIAVIDFGMGNLFSVCRACEHVGLNHVVCHHPQEIENADGLILPGVGAFGDAMKYLEEYGMAEAIKAFIKSNRPFLGICLGQQLLMTYSEEFGVHKGLDIIKGSVKRFPPVTAQGQRIKAPQMGWNQIYPAHFPLFPQDSVFVGIEPGEYFYFVHSYYVIPEDPTVIAAFSNYEGIEYCSGLQLKNIFATQFHPEKSCKQGLRFYKNFAKIVYQNTRSSGRIQNVDKNHIYSKDV